MSAVLSSLRLGFLFLGLIGLAVWTIRVLSIAVTTHHTMRWPAGVTIVPPRAFRDHPPQAWSAP